MTSYILHLTNACVIYLLTIIIIEVLKVVQQQQLSNNNCFTAFILYVATSLINRLNHLASRVLSLFNNISTVLHKLHCSSCRCRLRLFIYFPLSRYLCTCAFSSTHIACVLHMYILYSSMHLQDLRILDPNTNAGIHCNFG